MEFEDAIFNRYAFHKLKEKEATRRKEGPRRPMTADKGRASSGPDPPGDVKGGGPDN